jgi:GTP1/Obg family GTP-binding protein
MTNLEKLTAEFAELDRVTPRPLTHDDYAICALQFADDMFKRVNPSIIKQLERAGEDYSKLIGCFEELDAVKRDNANCAFTIARYKEEVSALQSANKQLEKIADDYSAELDKRNIEIKRLKKEMLRRADQEDDDVNDGKNSSHEHSEGKGGWSV